MEFNTNHLHGLFRDTMSRIEVLRLRVRQGVAVEDGNDFARYVLNAGMIELMRDNPERDKSLVKYFPYDADKLHDAAKSLREECCEFYEGKSRDAAGKAAGANKTDLEAIGYGLVALDDKMNSVLRALAQAGVAVSVRPVDAPTAVRTVEDTSGSGKALGAAR